MSLDAIAIAALTAVFGMHDCREHAGVIMSEADGSYFASPAVTGKDDTFTLHIKIYAGQHVAAIYHTHPGCTHSDESKFFSPQDIDMANALHVPSYIAVLTNGQVLRYTPGSDHRERTTHQLDSGRSAGSYVATIEAEYSDD